MHMALHMYNDIMHITENFNEKYIIRYDATSTVYKCVLNNIAFRSSVSYHYSYLVLCHIC